MLEHWLIKSKKIQHDVEFGKTIVCYKFAWLPTKMHSGTWLWFKKYVRTTILCFDLISEEEFAIHNRYTCDEYLIKLLKN